MITAEGGMIIRLQIEAGDSSYPSCLHSKPSTRQLTLSWALSWTETVVQASKLASMHERLNAQASALHD